MGPRAPTPLLFAVAAVIHTAPLPAVAFARVDKIDTAVGSATLSNSPAINVEQQTFDSKRACVQRGSGSRRTGPAVARKTSRWGCRKDAGCVRCLNSECNCIQIALRHGLLFVHRCQNIVDMLPQLASTLSDA